MNWQERRQELETLASDYSISMGQELELTEFRKITKAQLMKEYESKGFKSNAAQEREAYADQKYIEIVKGLSAATEKRCFAQWKLKIAEMGMGIWQTKEATERAKMTLR